MEDVAPGLLKQIQEEYRRRIQESKVLAEYEQARKAEKADYAGAARAARELGEILAAVYQNQLSSEVLPDGKMYYNIALRVLDPTMKENYEHVADCAEAAQEILNKNAGLGFKGGQTGGEPGRHRRNCEPGILGGTVRCCEMDSGRPGEDVRSEDCG